MRKITASDSHSVSLFVYLFTLLFVSRWHENPANKFKVTKQNLYTNRLKNRAGYYKESIVEDKISIESDIGYDFSFIDSVIRKYTTNQVPEYILK